MNLTKSIRGHINTTFPNLEMVTNNGLKYQQIKI